MFYPQNDTQFIREKTLAAFYIVIALVSAYILGSIPSAYIVGRLRKKTDIRQVGTRNMGAMNVFYEVGFIWGVVVLAMDIGKGVVSMAIAEKLGVNQYAYMAAGFVAVLGHSFPVFLGFKGGKGGATSIGVLIYLMKPWAVLINGGVFGLLLLITRAPTISYGLAFFCYPFISWFMFHRWDWIVFAAVLLMIPLVRYIPRIKEMRDRAGNWRRVLQRKNVSDRF
jgi:glycerol-3-phosphate acyltransferase PlsY